MAKIQTYRQQTSVSGLPTGVGNAPEGIGMVALGNAIQSASQDVVAGRAFTAARREEEARIVEAKREEQAQVAANTELMSARSEWLTRLQKHKADAPAGAANFTDSLLEEFDADLSTRLERAQTPQAKQYLRQQLSQVRLGLQQDAMTFEAGSIVDHKAGQLASSVDAARTAVEFRPQDFDVVAAEQGRAIIASGLPAEIQAKMTDDALDALSSSAVSGMIRSNPYGALVELNNERSQNTAIRALSFDDRQRLRGAAEAEIRSREVESRDARSRLRTDLNARVEDAQAAYLHGMEVDDPPSRADFLTAYPSDQAKDAERDYNAFAAIQRIGADLKVAARLPPQEQAELLAARAPAQVEGAADQIKAYDILASHIANLNRQLEADPAAYVAAYDPATRTAAAAMGQQMTPDTVDAYATASLSAQAVHGVTSPKLLTEGQAQQMGERLKLTGNGADVVGAIQAERDMWGRHWPRALTEASPKLNPVVQVMALETPITGSAAGPTLSMDPVPAARLATVAAMTKEDLGKLMPESVRMADIETEVQAQLADFSQTLIGAAGAESQLVQISDAATKLAASYVVGGDSATAAAERAANEVLLSRYTVGEFGGSFVRFPIGVDSDLVLEGLRGVSRQVVDVLETDYDEVAWRTLPDDTGLLLTDRATGRPVANADGKPYLLAFSQLAQFGVNGREAARRMSEAAAEAGGMGNVP